MKLYAYCLSDEVTDETVEGVCGVGRTPARLLRRGRIAAVVSEVEDKGVAATRENLLAHNHVNASVLSHTTPLPFRFGTLVGEERLADYVAANEGALASALARVRGCVEMGVKVIWDVAGRGGAAEAPPDEWGVEEPGSGTAYLLAKRRELRGDEILKNRAEEIAAWLDGLASDFARESSVAVNPSQSLVVRAAHLVERGRLEEYRRRLRAAGDERGDLRLLTSGPWPPYSFSEAR